MPRIVFDTFAVQAPRGWAEITQEVDAVNPPPTLAHRTGVGALQFSIGLYRSGSVPSPAPSDLLSLMRDWSNARGLRKSTDQVMEVGPPTLAAGSYRKAGDFIRVWIVAAEGSFALITYVCEYADLGAELSVCESIVRTLEFGPRRTRRRR